MKPSRTDMPPPSHRSASRWHRIAAAASATAMFAALSVAWVPTASADGIVCESISNGYTLEYLFENPDECPGGATLSDEFSGSVGPLKLQSGSVLKLILNGNDITIAGTNGAAGDDESGDGSNGTTALTVNKNGTLIIEGAGTLTAKGGDGGDGASGTESNPDGGNGGAGGNGIAGSGVIVLLGSVLKASGGDGGGGGVCYANNEDPEDAVCDNDDGAEENQEAGSRGAPGDEGIDVFSGSTVAIADPEGEESSVPTGVPTTFDGNGNDISQPSTFVVYAQGAAYGAAMMLMNAVSWPTRDGYDFDDWYTDPDDSESGILSSLKIGEEDILFARWTSLDDVDEGDGTDDGDGSGTGGSTPTPTATPTPTVTPTPTTAPEPSSTPTPEPTTSAENPASTEEPANSEAPVSSTPVPQPLPGADSAELAVDNSAPSRGGSIELTAEGFKPGTSVDFWMHSTPVYLGSAIADANGIARLAVTLNPEYIGEHHVQAIGVGPEGQARNLQQAITIDAPPALASTGTATLPMVALAFLLIAAGVGLVIAQRNRRATAVNHQ